MGENPPASPTQPPVWERNHNQLMDALTASPTQPPVWERNHQLHQHSDLYGKEITVQPVNGHILLLPPASPTQQPVWERNHQLHQHSDLYEERNHSTSQLMDASYSFHQLHQHSYLYGREITSLTNTVTNAATCMGEKSLYSFTNTDTCLGDSFHQLHQHSHLYGRENH